MSNISNCATNKIGILFSTSPYHFNYISSPILNYANFFITNIITDTLNWVNIDGAFIADSSYQYITIGNFYNNSNTDTILFNGTNCFAYYYIDDICLSTDSLTCNFSTEIKSLKEKEENEIFPNPVKDKIIININEKLSHEIIICVFKITGEIIVTKKYQNKNEIELDVSNYKKGIYFISIQNGNKIENKKIVIQ